MCSKQPRVSQLPEEMERELAKKLDALLQGLGAPHQLVPWDKMCPRWVQVVTPCLSAVRPLNVYPMAKQNDFLGLKCTGQSSVDFAEVLSQTGSLKGQECVGGWIP